MTITEKTAYLKGLLEGMEIDQSTKEGKLFAAIIEALDDIALSVADLDDEVGAINDEMDMMEESLDAIDEALDDLEDALDAIDEDLDDMTTITRMRKTKSWRMKICISWSAPPVKKRSSWTRTCWLRAA